MTHTLELPESVERVLERRARRHGVPLETLLLDLAQREAATEESAETARREAVRAGYGKYAHVGLTPELRRQMKDEELRQEAASLGAAL